MIQRKQSLWLLIAALLNCGVFYFDLYKYHVSNNMLLGKDKLPVPVDTFNRIQVINHYPSLIIALVMTVLPLVAIFMFKVRKRQVGLSIVAMLSTLSFITLTLQRITHISKLPSPPFDESYGIGAVLPVVAVAFIILAIIGIRKDDKLVKSMDRLR